MAINSIGRTQADTAGFIPQIWAQEALPVLRANLKLAKLVARDTDFEPGWHGKTLNIPYPGTFTAQDKTEGNPATVQQTLNAGMVSLTLNKYKTVDFLVEDWAQAQANSNLIQRYVTPAAIALAEQLETDLFANYVSLTGSAGTSGTDMTDAVIRTARKLLNDAKNPMEDRSMMISTKDEIALLGDTNLQTYFAFSQNQALKEGSIGRLYGFDLFTSQLVPVVTGTPNSTKCLAIHKNAILLATRPLPTPPADSGVHSATIMDPMSGLTIRTLFQYSADYRGVRVMFDLLYGSMCLRPTAGVVVLT